MTRGRKVFSTILLAAVIGSAAFTVTQAATVENRLSANKLSANRLSANKLSANRLSANRLAANMASAGEGSVVSVTAVTLASGETLSK